MKWDKLLAAILLIGGIGFASYSITSFVQQSSLVQEVDASQFEQHGKSTTSNSTASTMDAEEKEHWVIFPDRDRPKKGEHFADLYIPRLNSVLPIVEGTHEDELEKGVGHYSGSVLPGEPDNAVLSGHRDTVFRQMGKMQKGDELQVRTSEGTFIYVIDKMWITDPDDRTVIVPHDEPVLTLTTCYPFHFVGTAPDRYIMQAKLIEKI